MIDAPYCKKNKKKTEILTWSNITIIWRTSLTNKHWLLVDSLLVQLGQFSFEKVSQCTGKVMHVPAATPAKIYKFINYSTTAKTIKKFLTTPKTSSGLLMKGKESVNAHRLCCSSLWTPAEPLQTAEYHRKKFISGSGKMKPQGSLPFRPINIRDSLLLWAGLCKHSCKPSWKSVFWVSMKTCLSRSTAIHHHPRRMLTTCMCVFSHTICSSNRPVRDRRS